MTVGEFRRDCAKSIGTFAPEEAHVLCDILLANVLGCDRSALSAVLSRLKRAGVLDYHKNAFYFPERAGG